MTCTFSPSSWETNAEAIGRIEQDVTQRLQDQLDETPMTRSAQSPIDVAIVNGVRDRVMDLARVQMCITQRLQNVVTRMHTTAANYRSAEDHAEACAGGF